MPITSLSLIQESARYDHMIVSNDTTPSTACICLSLNLNTFGM